MKKQVVVPWLFRKFGNTLKHKVCELSRNMYFTEIHKNNRRLT